MSNSAVPRSQGRFARYHQIAATSDEDGQWIACDESGNEGENLLARQMVFSHGSVRADDQKAARVVDELRRRLRCRGQELKFEDFDRPAGVEALDWVLGRGGPLRGRARVYLSDKRFFAAGKAIDLLVEEDEHANGRDIYINGEARDIARKLFAEGASAVGRARFDVLVASFVALFRSREPARGRSTAVGEFFDAVTDARAHCTDPDIATVLDRIARARPHAVAFGRRLVAASGDEVPALDPLIPSLAQIIRFWGCRPGVKTLRVLHDRQNTLTDDRIDALLREIRTPPPEFRIFVDPVPVACLLRGDSHAHPSIQLADVIAGAGRAAGEFVLGLRSDAIAAELVDVVRPIIDEHSLWGDDATWVQLTGRRLDG